MKCTKCKGCLKHAWVSNSHYLFCTLCYNVYTIRQNKMIEITDIAIKQQLILQAGGVV